jgi:hypothetical protein
MKVCEKRLLTRHAACKNVYILNQNAVDTTSVLSKFSPAPERRALLFYNAVPPLPKQRFGQGTYYYTI